MIFPRSSFLIDLFGNSRHIAWFPNGSLLQYIFVPFSLIEKIGDGCSVIFAAFFHLHCFPMISYRKHADKDGHDVLEYHTAIFLFQLYLQKALEYCCRIVYAVSHKTSVLFVILLLPGINSIYHFRCNVLLFCAFCQFCSIIAPFERSDIQSSGFFWAF